MRRRQATLVEHLCIWIRPIGGESEMWDNARVGVRGDRHSCRDIDFSPLRGTKRGGVGDGRVEADGRIESVSRSTFHSFSVSTFRRLSQRAPRVITAKANTNVNALAKVKLPPVGLSPEYTEYGAWRRSSS